MNTKGYGGRKLKKDIIVYTNDKNTPHLNISIFGDVEPFAKIEPESVGMYGVRLNGSVGESIKQSVRIIPRKHYPFNVVSSKAKYGENIKFKIEKKRRWKGTEYLLIVENTKNGNGGYSDIVTLKTDSTIKPEIKIYIYGTINKRPPQGSN